MLSDSSNDRLTRIEDKLDGLVTDVTDLRMTTADLTVGQATFERSISTFGAVFEKIERDWTTVERLLTDLGGVRGLRTDMERGFAEVLHRFEHRVTPLEDANRLFRSRLDEHERRLAALEKHTP